MPPLDSHNLTLLLSILIAGVVACYTAGLFGIGGGIVLVPTFLTLFDYFGAAPAIVMHCAVATSLALIIPGALSASRTQYKAGKLDTKLYLRWIPMVALGSVIGAITIDFVHSQTLKIVFTGYLFVCITVVILKRTGAGDPDSYPRGLIRYTAGTVIGAFSTWLGIGGGTFTVPFYRLFNYPLKNAVALSTATALVIGLIATIGNLMTGRNEGGLPAYSWGYVNVAAFIIVAPIGILITPLGARTSNALPPRIHKWIYVAFLILVAAYMVTRIF